MSRPLTFVPTKFNLITTPRDALLRGLKSAVDQAGPSANSTSSNWSGAVDFGLGAGDSYVTVSGSWTVPNAYPPESAKLAAGGWKDGTYLCVSWVGIDGWGSPDVLQGGTGSECIVSGGKIQSQSAFGWFEWYPYSWTNFSDFSVKPGDSVNCLVCAPGGAGSTTGSVLLGNTSTGQYVSAQLTAPSGTKLVGNCAEWIMEDPSLGGSEAPFPDYAAEFFYDCQAGTAKNVEKNLSGATLLNLVESPPTTLSTAVAESDTILMTYAGNSGP
ncbi:concanavalin A-like lectin/glucanase [Stipitochalara longipes BDJ]|nr:concanavalin A-like lectin/glucanase [Stipitochalara longipes BDJ]